MRGNKFTLIDCVAGLLIVMLSAAWLISADVKELKTRNRIKCASNLRMIGQAMLLYANENRGQFPRTPSENKATEKPVWGTPYEGNKDLGAGDADPFVKDTADNAKFKPALNDVSAAIYMLLRTEDITAAVFVCPSTIQTAWDFGGEKGFAVNRWSNWQGKEGILKHLSYSMQNPYISRPALSKGLKWNNAIAADFAVFGDMNPGVDLLTQLKLTTPAEEMRKGNSINHGQDGQNLLYGDGHVEFQMTPFAGSVRDNVYTYGTTGDAKPDKGGDGVVGSSVDDKDSILLPTSVGVGSTDPLLTGGL